MPVDPFDDTQSPARMEGLLAAVTNRPMHECPYPHGSGDAEQWLDGYAQWADAPNEEVDDEPEPSDDSYDD